jgi:hypothetical protein
MIDNEGMISAAKLKGYIIQHQLVSMYGPSIIVAQSMLFMKHDYLQDTSCLLR